MGAMLRLPGSGEYETCRSGSAAVCIARARFRWRRRHQLWRASLLVWICDLNKRAARFAPSMVKNARRNNTMVCNECTAKQCKKYGTLMRRRHLKDGGICRACTSFRCKHCPEPLCTRDIGAAVARHATYDRVLQMCKGCEAAGKTLADGRPYKCVICKERKYRRRFDEKQILNHNERGGPLVFFEARARCAVCELWKETETQGWTATKLEDSRRKKKPTALVCGSCVGDGYGPADPKPYTCIGCRVTQGRYKFDKKDMNNNQQAEKQGKPYVLFCKVCRAREGRLLSLVKSPHAWKCKCGCPICIPHCPLYPGRCRGCNLGVRHEDIALLKKRPYNEKWLK